MTSWRRQFSLLVFCLVFSQTLNRLKSMRLETIGKHFLLLAFAAGVGWAEYAFFKQFWMLLGAVPFGYAILLPRLFSWMGTFLIAFLIYSSVLTALSSFYRSDDLPFLLSTPIHVPFILFMKWLDTAIRSGATLSLLALPPIIALGVQLHLSPLFYVVYVTAVLAFASVGVSIGVWLAMLLAAVFPVKRMHQTLAIVGLCLAAFVITAMRFLHLETLWSEDALQNPLLLFLQQDHSLLTRYAPGRLFAMAVDPFITSNGSSWSLWSVIGASAVFLAAILLGGRRLFMRGWWKSQEQGDPEVRTSSLLANRPSGRSRTSPLRTLLWKDWLMIKRDSSIWTQLFMMLPLAALYLLNLSFLPLEVNEFAPYYALADVGLVGLIIAALGARYLFPVASREGEAVWIIFVSPVKPAKIIGQKILLNVPPVMLLAVILLLGSALILHLPVPWTLWTLWYGTMISLFICLSAVLMGFCFPSFHYRHLLEVSLGKGSFFFMTLALAQIASWVYITLQLILHDSSAVLSLMQNKIVLWEGSCALVIIFCFWGARRRWAEW
ncbi:MAG: putative ABC transporter permease subunit [Candidatus Hinthialibacter sp.]